jgi:hypothetical protein
VTVFPHLIMLVATAANVPKGVLTFRSGGTQPVEFYRPR